MSKQGRHFYEFDAFRVNEQERVLFRDGEPVPLPPKVFETLLALVRESGHVIEKDELIKRVWPDTFVEENNLSQYISTLRKSLGDGPHEHRYIETVPRRGYRFAAGVREVWEGDGELVAATHTKISLKVKEETEEIEERAQEMARPVAATLPASRLKRRALLTAILLVACLITAAFWMSRPKNSADGANERPGFRSVAMLPFAPVGESGGDKLIGLGMADALIQRLGHNERAIVRPIGAVYKYSDLAPLDTRDTPFGLTDKIIAGEELGVDLLLHGTVERAGGRIKVTAQLVGMKGKAPLWIERFDEEESRIFAVQDALAARVARTLAPPGQESKLPSHRHTQNLEAYESYLSGLYFWNKRDSGDLNRSVLHFREAIRRDPDYALAHVGLAAAYSMGNFGDSEAAARAAGAALELDPTLGEAHATIGFRKMFVGYNLAEAEKDFERAIVLSPNYASAHHWYALLLAARGSFDEAVARMHRALEIDPHSLIINADLGQIYYFAKDYDRAVAQCRKVLAIDPNFRIARYYLYLAYTEKGMHREAFDEYINDQKHLGIIAPATLDELVKAYETEGIRGFWRAQSRRPENGWYTVAAYHAYLGENDKALYWMQKAVESKGDGFWFVYVKVDPAFDALHADPRFQELVRRFFPQDI